MTKKLTLTEEERDQRKKGLTELLTTTNSELGSTLTFMEGSTGLWADDQIIRTGSLDLDMCIGIGGWPRGRIIEFYGAESSGKTTLFLHTAAEAQKAGLTVVYIDAENALDPSYCRKLGVDLDLMLVAQPDSLQQAIDLMSNLMDKVIDGHIDQSLLIVVDSIPSLSPSEVLEASAEQQTRALAARYWSAQMPKLAQKAKRSGTTIALINQMRDSMDMYTPASTPGGRAIKFFASVRVQLKRKVEGKNQDGMEGQWCSFDVVKNKVGSPFRKGGFWLPPSKPIDWVSDVIMNAQYYDIVLSDTKFENGETFKKNKWVTYILQDGDANLIKKDFPESDLEDGDAITKYDVKNAFVEEMRYYPTLVEHIERRVLETLNQGVGVDAEIADQDLSPEGVSAGSDNEDEQYAEDE